MENRNLPVQMQRIAEKLNTLREFDQKHSYAMNPVVPEAKLKQWETANKVKLPEDYRWFITHIGNGGGWGPNYGMLPFDLSWAVSGTFPLVAPDYFSIDDNLDNFSDKYDDEDQASEKASEYQKKISDRCEKSAIPLAYEGCGIEIVMAVKGKAAGSVWTSDFGNEGGGIFPFEEADHAVSFLEWYEEWLDSCMAAFGPEPEQPKPAAKEVVLATATKDDSLQNYEQSPLMKEVGIFEEYLFVDEPSTYFLSDDKPDKKSKKNQLPLNGEMAESDYANVKTMGISTYDKLKIEVPSYLGKLPNLTKLWMPLFLLEKTVDGDLPKQLELLKLYYFSTHKKAGLTGQWPDTVLPALKYLIFDDEEKSSPAVYNIDDKKLPALEGMSFYMHKHPDRIGMVKNFAHLQSLYLQYVGDVNVFDYIGDSLRILHMTDYRSKQLAGIVKLKNLELLILDGVSQEIDFTIFTQLPKLKELHIAHPKKARNMMKIAQCPSLRTVTFRACYLDEEFVEELREQGRDFKYFFTINKTLVIEFAPIETEATKKEEANNPAIVAGNHFVRPTMDDAARNAKKTEIEAASLKYKDLLERAVSVDVSTKDFKPESLSKIKKAGYLTVKYVGKNDDIFNLISAPLKGLAMCDAKPAFDLSKIKTLTALEVIDLNSFAEVDCQAFTQLPNLKSVMFSWCKKMKNFNALLDIPTLQYIQISQCGSIDSFHEEAIRRGVKGFFQPHPKFYGVMEVYICNALEPQNENVEIMVEEPTATAAQSNSSTAIDTHIGNAWDDVLKKEFEADYFKKLQDFMQEEYAAKTIYPAKENIFNTLKFTAPDKVRVVILGQDPYINEGQAHGFALSVLPGVTPPPSLKNMYKELESDLGIPQSKSGHLIKWAGQGVLLLNTVLTVEAGKSNSHAKKGWEKFTDAVFAYLGASEQPIVFMLWGKPAQAKEKFITGKSHCIIKSPHPSPLSASTGFFGSKPYSQANAFLKSKGLKEIDWRVE